MKNISMLCFVLILITHAYSNPTFKIGGTLSNFQNINDKSVVGKSFGIGWDWQVYNYTTIGFDLMYSEYGGNIENIKILLENAVPKVYLYSYDLSINVGYLLLPLKASLDFPLNRDLKIKIGFGKILPIAINDNSVLKDKITLLELKGNLDNYDELSKMHYHYWGSEKSLGPQKLKFSDNYYFINIQFTRFSLEFKYQHDGQFIERVLYFTKIYEKSHSFSLILGIQL